MINHTASKHPGQLRFILDEKKGWFYADINSPWSNWSNELTDTRGRGEYYINSKTGKTKNRKTINMVFDRFSGEFILNL
jgi:hypothetical protein